MKQNKDQQKVSDLLKRLQASYLGDKNSKKKEKESDTSDREFQKKLTAMLGKVSEDSSKKSQKAKRAEKPQATEEPKESVEAPVAEETLRQEAVKAEEMTEPEAVSVPESASAPQKEKKKPKKEAPEKTKKEIEETVSQPEEPIDEPMEIVEEEDQTLEKSVTEERTEPIETAAEKETDFPIPSPEPIEEPPVQKTVVPEEKSELISEPVPEPDSETDSETVLESAPEQASEPQTHTHPLELVVPLAKPAEMPKIEERTQIKEEAKAATRSDVQKAAPSVRTVKPSVPSDEPKEAIPATSAPIPIKPKSMPQDPKKTIQTPIVIKPAEQKRGITIPAPSNAPDFAKSADKPEKATNSIVIRPPAAKNTPVSETIVIRPRTAVKHTPSPQIVREEIAEAPIKIGKEVPPDFQRNTTDKPLETPKPSMKKEQNTTFIPAAPVKGEATEPKKPAVAKTAAQAKPVPKKAGMALPRAVTPKASVTSARPTPAKKKTPQASRQPAAKAHPEDENLEEVLDEALPEEDIIEEIPMEEPEETATPTKKLSLFQRRQQQKQQLAEQKLSAMEVICKRSGLTEDDVAMLFELGYENELGRLVGYENLKRLKSEHLKRVSKHESKHYNTAIGYRGEEFVSNQNRNAVSAAYVHDRKSLIFRLIMSALISLLLLFADMPHLLGAYLTKIDVSYPLLLPILGMILFALTAFLSKRQILAGARSLFRFSPTPYSVCAVLPPLVLLYDLASFFAKSPMLQVNFLTSLSFLATAVCDMLRLSCEMRTLQILSAEGTKTVLAPTTPYKKKLRRGEKIVKIVSDDIGENLYQVRSANQTVGFFRRFNAMRTANRPFTVLIATMISAATLLSFAVAVATSSLSATLSAFMVLLSVTTPLSATFTFFYPLAHANKLLSKRNCTLLGEEAVEEYEDKKTVIFRDTDLFTAEKRTEISVRDGNDFRNDIRLAGILFRKLGGTLETAGDTASPLRTDPPVSIVRIQETGVEAMIDNKYHVLAGNAAFLSRSGIRVPTESTDQALRRAENVSLMYVAVDGIMKLSYEIEYRSNGKFEDTIRELADIGTAVAINTYDPNLNESFLQKCRPDAADPVQTVKPGRFEEEKPLEIVDTGAVALGKKTDIAYPLYAAHGISQVRRFGFRIQLIASLVGAAAVLLLNLFGKQDFIGILPIACYQIFWIAVSFIATHSELNGDKLRFD